MGADKPVDYGGYYAWGETEEKDVYSEVTYQYCTGENPNDYGWYENTQYQDLGSDIAGTQYDVAHVKWGGSWVMPSLDQIKELYNNCFCGLTSMNGVKGQKFISKNNGAIIFMPASALFNEGLIGEYWSSTQKPSDLKWAYGFYFHPDGSSWDFFSHPLPLSVRPVISETTSINLPGSSSDKSCQAIYNLCGMKVADTMADMNTLPPGIYIVNGKKIVMK